MLKALLLAASFATFVLAGLPLDQSSARAEQMTCREAAKAKFPGEIVQGRLESAQAQPSAPSAESLVTPAADLPPVPSPRLGRLSCRIL